MPPAARDASTGRRRRRRRCGRRAASDGAGRPRRGRALRGAGRRSMRSKCGALHGASLSSSRRRLDAGGDEQRARGRALQRAHQRARRRRRAPARPASRPATARRRRSCSSAAMPAAGRPAVRPWSRNSAISVIAPKPNSRGDVPASRRRITDAPSATRSDLAAPHRRRRVAAASARRRRRSMRGCRRPCSARRSAAFSASALPMSGGATPARTATPTPTLPIGARGPSTGCRSRRARRATPCGTMITSAAGAARSAARNAGAAANSMRDRVAALALERRERRPHARLDRACRQHAQLERVQRQARTRAGGSDPARAIRSTDGGGRSMRCGSVRGRRASRACSWAFTSGHSPAVMLYITVSRTVPSRRSAWWRSTPSLLRAEPLDRALAREVEVVGAPADQLRAERLERVRHQQQLAAGVDVAALPALRVPGVADLERARPPARCRGSCVLPITCAARGVEHGERQPVALARRPAARRSM